MSKIVSLFVLALLLCDVGRVQSQTPTAAKAEWLGRDGLFRDGVRNEASIVFAMLESGRIDQVWLNDYLGRLHSALEWYDGARGAGPIAAQLCLWFPSILPGSAKSLLWEKLLDAAADDNYFAQVCNNGQVNCMFVRAVMGKYLPGRTVEYRYIEDPDFNGDFVFNGVSYRLGQRYPIGELGQAWLQWFALRYVDNGYIHGELFSETYGLHFLNAFMAAADPRSGLTADFRARMAMLADLFLADHGFAFNGHHLGGPLGRTYLDSHLYGRDFFFPWEVYFGVAWPTHYGHSGAFFSSSYRLASTIETAVRSALPRVVTSSLQGGRYVLVTDRYTLGSSPASGDWLLEINSDDFGPFPQSRPGFNFRLWLNPYPDDLDPAKCSGECYAEMGKLGRQYRDAIFLPGAGLVLHEALAGSRWNLLESASGWRFSEENGVAVAIRLTPNAAALEVSRLGIDDKDYPAFRAAVLAASRLVSPAEYVTRRGDRLQVVNDRLLVNGVAFNDRLPRLSVLGADGQTLASSPAARVFDLAGRVYDFNAWGVTVPPVATRPTPPVGLVLSP